MLFHVYADEKPEGYYVNEPFGIYRTILDADWLLWILLPILLVLAIAGLMLAWHLHEIPKHKAQKKKMRQAELVSALTLLGLFEHWVWAVALFLAYADWDGIEDFMVRVLRRSRTEIPDGQMNSNPGKASSAVLVEPSAARSGPSGPEESKA